MGSTFFRKLPTPMEIKTMYPVPEAVAETEKRTMQKFVIFSQVQVTNLLLSSALVQQIIRKLLRITFKD